MSSAEASGSSVVRGAKCCHLACQAIRSFMFADERFLPARPLLSISRRIRGFKPE
jgi:hypothetical protein